MSSTARNQHPKSRETRLAIVRALEHEPGIGPARLAEIVRRSRQDVNYHLHELASRSIVCESGEGPRRGPRAEKLYQLTPRAAAAANEIECDFAEPFPRIAPTTEEARRAGLPLGAVGPRCPSCELACGRPERRGRAGFLECFACRRVWRPRGKHAAELIRLGLEALETDRRAAARWETMGERARLRYLQRTPPRFDALGEQLAFNWMQ